jgi:hypothetical protein
MLAYKINTQIGFDGKILIPDYLRIYYSQQVEIIILIPEQINKAQNNVLHFYELIEKFNSINEHDIDINNIYINRQKENKRQFDFN